MLRSQFAEQGGERMADQPSPYERASDLPLFEAPPVDDVSISIQFQPLPLRSIDLGVLRERLADRYPQVDEAPPSLLQVENLTPGVRPEFEIRFALLDRPPIPLLIFTSGDQSSQIQVQGDRLACVWRRTEAVGYPRYERLRDDFVRSANIFIEFVEDVAEGTDVRVIQAEITYVNTIQTDGDTRPDVLASSVPLPHLGTDSLQVSGMIVNHALTFRNSDGVDYARLHVKAEPAGVDSSQDLRLALTYRGEPWERDQSKPSLGTLMRFFDEGHDVIVRSFAANTTLEAQQSWGRSQ